MSFIETQFEKYKSGGCVHLSCPTDELLEQEELKTLNEQRKLLLMKIIAYETSRGNITTKNGKMIIKPSVRIPTVKCADNMWCCVSECDRQNCEEQL